MPDLLFDDPRLAAIYDYLEDPLRPDLDPYVALAGEFGAQTIVDIGCGTGTLACRLASLGLNVIGVDPAAASLDVARRKAGAQRVRWLHGDASILPPLEADLITMTGNVAQVFLTDTEWESTLRVARSALRPGGRIAFESRNPQKKAWLQWAKDQSFRRVTIPEVGAVETWVELMEVREPLISFRSAFAFPNGDVLTSDSTLRFRSKAEIEESLASAHLTAEEVRDAPDRPGLEWVFIARRREELPDHSE